VAHKPANELKTRTERLHPFAEREDVHACLQRLADRVDPLVRRLERRPGQQDHRWVHLLGPAGPVTSVRGAIVEPEVMWTSVPLSARLSSFRELPLWSSGPLTQFSWNGSRRT
jgi:uncharacterized protein YceH (UPF0502 family)